MLAASKANYLLINQNELIAQGDSTYVDDFFGGGGAHFLAELTGGGTLVRVFLNVSAFVAGIILIFLIISGGIGMIAGAGRNDPQQIEKGKKALTSALIGFIIIITGFWVIRLIEIIAGRSFITGI